jgi:glycosyltransferase involved in cell wall biosynthesis
MISVSKEKYIIGINAYNIRAGGGITHLSEILNNITFNNLNIEKIILWAPELTLSKINKKPWLLKVTTETESKSFLSRYKWLLFNFKSELIKYKIDILLIPGGTYLGSFRPFITINQNLLPFESNEIKRYGLSPNFFKFHILKLLQCITNRNSNGIIFLTNYAMKQVLKVCKLSNKIYRIIPHGVNERFNYNPANRRFRNFDDFSKEFPCKILYISSIEIYKHQWVVIEAIRFLYENGYNVKLTLVGPKGSGSKKLENILQGIKPELVEYIGLASYETIENLYLNADLGIFASSCETFGMILTESMSCGLPLAASNMSAIPDVLSDAGLYFNPENSDEIAEAIKKMMISSDLRRDLAKKGYTHVKKFNWINSSNDTFNFIEEILKNYKK